jgi:hypothetical protein
MSAAMKNATVIQFSIQRLQCSACGAEANASCNCGKPYVPAAVRVREYDEKNPSKSTRQAAADLGMSQSRVQQSRKSAEQGYSPAGVTQVTPETVTGRDGKQYPAKRRVEIVTVEDELYPDEYRKAFILRTRDAMSFAVYSGEVDAEVIAAAKRVAATWNEFGQTLEARCGPNERANAEEIAKFVDKVSLLAKACNDGAAFEIPAVVSPELLHQATKCIEGVIKELRVLRRRLQGDYTERGEAARHVD